MKSGANLTKVRRVACLEIKHFLIMPFMQTRLTQSSPRNFDARVPLVCDDRITKAIKDSLRSLTVKKSSDLHDIVRLADPTPDVLLAKVARRLVDYLTKSLNPVCIHYSRACKLFHLGVSLDDRKAMVDEAVRRYYGEREPVIARRLQGHFEVLIDRAITASHPSLADNSLLGGLRRRDALKAQIIADDRTRTDSDIYAVKRIDVKPGTYVHSKRGIFKALDRARIDALSQCFLNSVNQYNSDEEVRRRKLGVWGKSIKERSARLMEPAVAIVEKINRAWSDMLHYKEWERKNRWASLNQRINPSAEISVGIGISFTEEIVTGEPSFRPTINGARVGLPPTRIQYEYPIYSLLSAAIEKALPDEARELRLAYRLMREKVQWIRAQPGYVAPDIYFG